MPPEWLRVRMTVKRSVSELIMQQIIANDPNAQEYWFTRMIDCVSELHQNDIIHRDIKPQNFLIDGEGLVVSDFGLTTEIGSSTAFTQSSAWWGTHGYIPPEFMAGGFKNADATGDIFMIGKTIYCLLIRRIFNVVENTQEDELKAFHPI